MREGFSSEKLQEATKDLYEAVDSLNEALVQRAAAEGVPVACRKGCSWCCNQTVFGVSHEFIYLENFLSRNFSQEEREKIFERARTKHATTGSLNASERLLHKEACPLLENGSCMVYEARPMACRIYLSSEEESCRKEYLQPDNVREFPALFSFPLQAGRMMNEGFTACLREYSFNSRELTIEEGLLSRS